jgi:hypothetical protein
MLYEEKPIPFHATLVFHFTRSYRPDFSYNSNDIASNVGSECSHEFLLQLTRVTHLLSISFIEKQNVFRNRLHLSDFHKEKF